MRRKGLNISELRLRVHESEQASGSPSSKDWLLDLLKSRVTQYLHKLRISHDLEITYDLELTNACNTSCIFCPRDKTPKQGFIDFNTFKKAIQRAKESGVVRSIVSSGLGEPLLHPKVVNFARFATDEGLDYNITTNASLLKRELANELIDAGLKGICLSVSGINSTYEEIHRLNFEVTKTNILDFIDVSNGRCKATISITICDENRNEIDQTIRFWKKNGIKKFLLFDVNNRGGAVDINLSYLKSERLYHQAVEILKSNNISTMCWAPFRYWFVGWDGNYYLCCNEYGKKFPLGNVFDKSMKEISVIKERCLLDNPNICRNCDISPISMIMDVLSRIERREAKQSELDMLTKSLKTGQVEGMLLKNKTLQKID